ncbi:MAG TPA: DUF2950 domain-containing protein [Steroidobacteraceae bacterium]|nr:DUF2950 domain-containing protein [Steroidobacteraceae bacterium]
MNSGPSTRISRALAAALLCVCVAGWGSLRAAAPANGAQKFDTPQQAADAIIAAADKFDVPAIKRILGAGKDDVVLGGEPAQNRELAAEFAARAHEKTAISIDPHTKDRAILLIGKEDWPFAVPIVKRGQSWSFDADAGRTELLNRLIGRNELDAIALCHGYVEAQYEYAFTKRQDYQVAQYAQRIIATPGKQDGLAWRNADGTWGGPVGENVAHAIQQGYAQKTRPYHGYYFKVLKGQGPSAPHGASNFVVKGLMIGGFALVAAPAEYGHTGVKTFIVSQDGIVYEKDLGPDTLARFEKMTLYDPDKSWSPVKE